MTLIDSVVVVWLMGLTRTFTNVVPNVDCTVIENVTAFLSLDTPTASDLIHVSPIPATNKRNIELPFGMSSGWFIIEVYGMDGTHHMSQENTLSADIFKLEKGTSIPRFINENGRMNKKIVMF